jgi:hypothetical protein
MSVHVCMCVCVHVGVCVCVCACVSSGLALLSLHLNSSSATKFSGPAVQHPFWAGLWQRKQIGDVLGPVPGVGVMAKRSQGGVGEV